MQVHAVPESERALDASGKRLPWGYEYAEYVLVLYSEDGYQVYAAF